jgi:hypothetical protein
MCDTTAANVKPFEVAVIGNRCRIGHDNMGEGKRARRGAWARCAGILGVDAVVECVELQCRFVPEHSSVDARQRAWWRTLRNRWMRTWDTLPLSHQRIW